MNLEEKLYNKFEIKPNNFKDNTFIFEILITNLPKSYNFSRGSDLKCDFIFSKGIYDVNNKLLNSYKIQLFNMTLYHKDLNGNLIKKYNHIFFDEVSKKNIILSSINFSKVMLPINLKILQNYVFN